MPGGQISAGSRLAAAVVSSTTGPTEPASSARTASAPGPEPRRLRGVESVPGGGSARVHLVLPRSFNDAQQIADRFKEGVPVILNLQGCDQELSKRLIDFGSGLTYALDGGMQRVADKVFLLTPRNVEVSAEERARLLERGGFSTGLRWGAKAFPRNLVHNQVAAAVLLSRRRR